MNHATFVISTGRCGTQWLAHNLSRHLGDRAVVTHEPLHAAWAPREMLGAGDPHLLDADVAEPILAHIAAIDEILRQKPYIECGHPSWSSIPYLIRRFEGRIRIMHLVRHPVPTAFSWLTQYAYVPARLPHLAEKVLLSPFDEGVRYPSWRERWALLNPYEKALYYWLEVNAMALRLAAADEVPWLFVRYEELLQGVRSDDVFSFASGQSERDVALERAQVDDLHFLSPHWSDPRAIDHHPDVIDVARRCGYDPLAFDEKALRRRYLP